MGEIMVVRRRRSLRLPTFDYATFGAYFITICIRERECLLGDVVTGEVCLIPFPCSLVV